MTKLKESCSDNKEKNLEVQALYFNSENGSYETYHVFNFTLLNSCETLVINLNENIKLGSINKEIISNLLYFGSKVEVKSIAMILSRKSKDYVKILQGLMTVGFKTEAGNNSRFLSGKTGTNCKVLKMELTKIDDVQEIDF
mmetsp:Transcript_7813/g.8057  ORF Transcript_7813/g.8057 Transcript_7813/m.8057 type:complete len:141 (+) Transcript_7813:180-602(+)